MPLLLLLHRVWGITFIEVIITIAIIAILTVMALPSLFSFASEHQVSGAAQGLHYYLQNARSEAIKRNQTVYVNFQTGASWCYGMNAGSNCSCNTANSCGLGTVSVPSHQNTTLTATGLTSGSLSFDGVRANAGATSLITFTATGQATAMGVNVTKLGTLTLCSSTISGYSACP